MTSMAAAPRIAFFREKAGLTLERLAELSGIKRELLTRFESGSEQPHFDHLGKLAGVLRVPVLSLLSASAEPEPAISTWSPLARTLAEARRKSRLELASAANSLGISATQLKKAEAGEEPLSAEKVAQAAVLYSLDSQLLLELAHLEAAHPAICRRLQEMTGLLETFRFLAKDGGAHWGGGDWRGLLAQLDHCLDGSLANDREAEREASYFSIGHMSDRLLQALQDPEFHAYVEELARQYEMKHPPAPSDNPGSSSGNGEYEEPF